MTGHLPSVVIRPLPEAWLDGQAWLTFPRLSSAKADPHYSDDKINQRFLDVLICNCLWLGYLNNVIFYSRQRSNYHEENVMMECILFDLQFLWFMNLKATLNNLFRTRSSLFNIGTNMKWLRFINISNESVDVWVM